MWKWETDVEAIIRDSHVKSEAAGTDSPTPIYTSPPCYHLCTLLARCSPVHAIAQARLTQAYHSRKQPHCAQIQELPQRTPNICCAASLCWPLLALPHVARTVGWPPHATPHAMHGGACIALLLAPNTSHTRRVPCTATPLHAAPCHPLLAPPLYVARTAYMCAALAPSARLAATYPCVSRVPCRSPMLTPVRPGMHCATTRRRTSYACPATSRCCGAHMLTSRWGAVCTAGLALRCYPPLHAIHGEAHAYGMRRGVAALRRGIHCVATRRCTRAPPLRKQALAGAHAHAHLTATRAAHHTRAPLRTHALAGAICTARLALRCYPPLHTVYGGANTHGVRRGVQWVAA
ncbi:hypothetical protein GGX14DRAFT_671582 [Mycena pura]|uniref:Uncharacterized protein n=1 Tax=Mycena pura TaxID=153505 RepID=A0AAD6UX65_9AGAR|nr:hypothetical protein GGX14DRAFT_671582 [Mycena pura]